jgi:hypothetical protein
MRGLIFPVSTTGSVIGALRYELARLRGPRSLRGAVLVSLTSSALLTLLAARQMVGQGRPRQPQSRSAQIGALASQTDLSHALSHVFGLASQLQSHYTPMPGDGAWVVAGGVAGMVLPGIAAAFGAAWFGATAIGYEYRYGSGLLTFALVPRRGSVLVAKIVVAAAFGALLSLGTTAIAYGTARVGFHVAGMQIGLPAALIVPEPREVAMAALGGVLGVFAGAVLRVRVLATLSALVGCALVAAFVPRSSSLAVPYLAEAVRCTVRVVPTLTYSTAADLLVGVPLVVLAWAGLVAVRRRRIV